MNSSLRELFGRLGPVRAIDRVPSGTPGTFRVRRVSYDPDLKRIDAVMTLSRRGLSLLDAKRSIERIIEQGDAVVTLPCVDDAATVGAELGAAGFAATPVRPRGLLHVRSLRRRAALDVRGLRRRLHLTREQFALRYGLDVDTVRGWETGRVALDSTARSYLRAIANDPEHVATAVAR